MIYLASDHAGFQLKNQLSSWLEAHGHQVEDLGPELLEVGDDYPDYALPLAEAVSRHHQALGILICRNGQGMAIAANKIRGIRAAVAWSPSVARSARIDDHCNVLTLPADYLATQSWLGPNQHQGNVHDRAQERLALAKQIIDSWLSAVPSQDSRHLARLAKIETYEREH